MFRVSLIAALLGAGINAAAAASPVADVRGMKKPDHSDHEALGDYRSRLFGVYRNCADAAEDRFLSQDEVDACSLAFLKMKLSFLDGVTLDLYRAMTPSLRATANREGYDSYRAWLRRQGTGLRID